MFPFPIKMRHFTSFKSPVLWSWHYTMAPNNRWWIMNRDKTIDHYWTCKFGSYKNEGEKKCSNLGEPLGCLDWFHWSSPAADWHISTTQASPPFSATASAEVIGGKSWGHSNHLRGRGVTRPLKLTQNASETMAGERPNLGSRIVF